MRALDTALYFLGRVWTLRGCAGQACRQETEPAKPFVAIAARNSEKRPRFSVPFLTRIFFSLKMSGKIATLLYEIC